jgi:cell division protein FtsJ
MKSKQWLNRQKKDPFVIKAQQEGFLSRAAFKLIEIENKFKLINNSKNILELGASPGSWSQVIINLNSKAIITAIDIIEMKFNHSNIKFYKNNFLNIDFKAYNKKYDLILSDISPNTTGHKSTDHLRICSYIFDIIDILDLIANRNSSFVTKIWKGKEEDLIIKKLKNKYNQVSYFKPKSSRKDSSEIFIVAQNFIN